MIVYIEECYWC